jgi:hypothetical protein
MRRSFVTVIAVGGLTWGVGSAFGDVPNANSIACPSAPSGWTLPVGQNARYVHSPDPTDATPNGGLDPGIDQVAVSCSYFNSAGRPLVITTAYALPSSFNPWSDFDFGCTSVNHVPGYLPVTGFPWDTQHRIYFVLSSKSWSYAEFQDPYTVLSSSDVRPFESITNALLASAQPAAHNCQLPGGGNPVTVQAPWTFSFKVSATIANGSISGGTKGSFVTAPSATGTTSVISDLHAANILLTTKTKGSQTRRITIRVGQPLSFRAFYTNTLMTAISVVRSNYPSCPTGSTGTMTVTSDPAPAVQLNICGDLVPQGAHEQTAATISNP